MHRESFQSLGSIVADETIVGENCYLENGSRYTASSSYWGFLDHTLGE